jgi:hypothetical protein
MNTQSQVESQDVLPTESKTNNETQEQKLSAIIEKAIMSVQRKLAIKGFIKGNELKKFTSECIVACISKIILNKKDDDDAKTDSMRECILNAIGEMSAANTSVTTSIDAERFNECFLSSDISPKTSINLTEDEVYQVKDDILNIFRKSFGHAKYNLTVNGWPEFVLQIKYKESMNMYYLAFSPIKNETESKSDSKTKLDSEVRQMLFDRLRASKYIPEIKKYLQSENFKNSFETIMAEYITSILSDNEDGCKKKMIAAISHIMKDPKNKEYVDITPDFFKKSLVHFVQIPDFLNDLSDEAVTDFQTDAVNELISSMNICERNKNSKMVVVNVNLSEGINFRFRIYIENYEERDLYVRLYFCNCEETSS